MKSLLDLAIRTIAARDQFKREPGKTESSDRKRCVKVRKDCVPGM
jgi:hypothetical protein